MKQSRGKKGSAGNPADVDWSITGPAVNSIFQNAKPVLWWAQALATLREMNLIALRFHEEAGGGSLAGRTNPTAWQLFAAQATRAADLLTLCVISTPTPGIDRLADPFAKVEDSSTPGEDRP